MCSRAFATLFLACSLARADWPLFRGDPAQTGVAPAALPGSLKPAWKITGLESVEGSVAIAEGKVFASSGDGFARKIDLATGRVEWKCKIGPAKAPVSIRDGVVHAGDIEGKLHAIDAASGKVKWTFDCGAEISGGACYAQGALLFGAHDDTLHCLDLASGKEKWNFKTEGPYYGSVAVVAGKTFAAGCDSRLHVIDVATGKETGSLDLGSQTGATVAVSGDHLYLGTMGSEFHAIAWKEPKIAWTYRPANRPKEFFSSAAVGPLLAVVGSRDNRVHAIDRKTGMPRWTYLTDGRVDASPVIAGDKVYAPSLDGKLHVLDLASGKKLEAHDLGGPLAASPAISDGFLVVGTTEGVLAAFKAAN